MMQQILFIIILFLSFIPVSHAEDPNKQTVTIVVSNVFLNDPTDLLTPPENTKIENTFPSTDQPSYIAVSYEITNTITTKKLNLEGNRELLLIDEFGNEYRQINRPEKFNGPVIKPPKSFPSLYPGERYTETVFFEPPIAAAKGLKLIVNAKSLRMDKPAELFIDISDRASLRTSGNKSIIPSSVDLRIVDPQNGTILNQGDVIHIRVMASGDKPPKKIIVVALNTYFEDKSPAFENVYDLNVPLEQEPGNYVINVIANWAGSRSDNNITLSDTLSIDIKETVPLPAL
jgi:hypothetical protein